MEIVETSFPTTDVNMRLEYDFSEFEKNPEHFLELVAEMAGCSPEELQIREAFSGCTVVTIRFPCPAAAKAFIEDIRQGKTLAAREFIQYYRPERIVQCYDEEYPAPAPSVVVTGEPGGHFTWLHISDLHLEGQSGAIGTSWDQDVVTNRFLRDLPENLREHDLNLSAIFFTGDATKHASVDEYRKVRTFLTELRSTVGREVPVFIVPGNHDVVWDSVTLDEEQEFIDMGSQIGTLNQLMLGADPDAEKRMLSRFNRYSKLWQWVQQENGAALDATMSLDWVVDQPRRRCRGLWYSARLKIREDLTIGIIGLNSVLLSKSKSTPDRSDQESLALGEVQLDTLYGSLDKVDMQIALVHHPLDTAWYATTDRHRHRERLPQTDFVLSGHEHDCSEIVTRESGAAQSSNRISAGALFDGRDKRANSFNVVRVDYQQHVATIYAWRFGETRRKWVPDTDRWDNGRSTLQLRRDFFG